VASGVDERTLKREGVCAASLPTTMVIPSQTLLNDLISRSNSDTVMSSWNVILIVRNIMYTFG
jgi:hypothetical protein